MLDVDVDVDVGGERLDLLSSIETVPQHDAATCLRDLDGQLPDISRRLVERSAIRGLIRRLIDSARKQTHQLMPANIVETDTLDVGVIQSARTSCTLLIVTTTSSVEVSALATGMGTTTALTREG